MLKYNISENNPLKVLSLFSGIGAFEKGLSNNDIPYKTINYCEIDKYASTSYSAIHNVSEDLNLGDINKVNPYNIEDFDLLVWGSPCVDFSVAGNMKGSIWTCKKCGESYNPLKLSFTSREICPICGNDNIEKTSSSLLAEGIRIISAKKPKFIVYENVKNISIKFKDVFNLYLMELNKLGYKNYYKILNTSNFDLPQSRERLFLVSIRDDVFKEDFEFPIGSSTELNIRDFLEDFNEELFIKEDFYIADIINEKRKRIITYPYVMKVKVRKYDVNIPKLQNLLKEHKEKQGVTIKDISDSLKIEYTTVAHWFRRDKCFSIPDPNNWTRLKKILKIENNEFDESIMTFIEKDSSYDKRNRVYDELGYSPTLTKTSSDEKVLLRINGEYRIKHLSPLETYKLMGFSKIDYEKSIAALLNKYPNIKNHYKQIYYQAGNSIGVTVTTSIFSKLFKE